MNLRGNHKLTIDGKGRVAVPASYRDNLAKICDSKLVITHNPYRDDNCLVVYPENNWQKVEQQLQNLPNSKQVRNAISRLVQSAIDINIDKGGRILIPLSFREEYGLTKEVIFAGNITHFQIWLPEQHQQHLAVASFEELEEFKEVRF